MGIKSNNSAASFHDFFSRSGKDAVSPAPPPPLPFEATGGASYVPGDGYKYHHFATVGDSSFTVVGSSTCDVFVVGGGGGGAAGSNNGGFGGGGGGAGGIAYKSGLEITSGTYTVTVGNGGLGGTNWSSGGNAVNGDDSTFDAPGAGPFPFVGKGGGAGRNNTVAGVAGGSGGGSGSSPSGPAAGGASTGNSVPAGGTTYGNAGGTSVVGNDPFAGGGGGGAGQVGYPGGNQGDWPVGNNSRGGNGIGSPTIPWLPTAYGDSGYFAGGGAGAAWSDSGPGSTPFNIEGGQGGGGDSRGGAPLGTVTAGQRNTGGGGGGGNGNPSVHGQPGGSGIIIIRYPHTEPTPPVQGGDFIATPGNGYKYHTFTAPGTLILSGSKDLEVLIVGAGGCGRDGGGAAGGGGGGGEIIHRSSLPQSAGSYPIVVGGISPVKSYNFPEHTPTSFKSSSAFGLTADGGGDGGAYSPLLDGQPGGSGGGGGSYPTGGNGGAATGGGGAGGAGSGGPDPAQAGGGGGGAAGNNGKPGAPGPSTRSDGGNGSQYSQFEGTLIGMPALAPLNGYFAGGGGGGIRVASAPERSQGGLGGGGLGGTRDSSLSGGNGVTGSGGGGGGASSTGAGPAGAGGSGIVIIRYQV